MTTRSPTEKIPGSYAYGYRPRPGGPGEPVIDKNEAKIVLRIVTERVGACGARRAIRDD
jgi:site-specific DNA recombinase